MRVASGSTNKKVLFVAKDATDFTTNETGLSSFTVYRSRDGGTATAYTTPTVSELSSSNMPGVYALTVDEDTTITSGDDEESYVLRITHAGMAPVTLELELYRPKITEGYTLGVESDGDLTKVNTLNGHTAQTGDTYAQLPTNFSSLGIESDGDLTKVNTLDGHTAQTADHTAGIAAIPTTMRGTDNAALASVLGAAVGASISADVAAVKSDTGTLVTRITSTLFSGITSLANWLGAMAGSHTADSTAITEIQASGGGSGTYDEANESLEALRARGDAGWTTGGGGSAPTVSEIRAEIDSNSTQLAAIVADTNELQTDWADGGRLDLIVDAIKAKTDNLPASPAAVGSEMALEDDAITAAKIATDAIGSDEIAASAVTEIQSGLSTFDPTSDDVAVVTLVNTTTTNTDMRGTDSAYTGTPPSAAAIAAAILAAGDVDGYSVEETLKLCLSALAAKLSGAATATVTIRAADDSKDRITATVDASGNRSAVTLDATG